jgi:saccharopine dehydrogenase-like NADP-dependent oxidoreductase
MTGFRGGERVVVTYDSIAKPNLKWQIDGGTIGTGTPASIAAQWIARGKITARGVVPPEVAVEPLAFFRELGAKGRTIEVWERDAEERLLSGSA